ncbi:1,4-alpha-glucan branching enzyme [Geobacillus sp. 46C-IIa]|uniref:1,4-alpha-glucan branching enzyme n=1 Tax=Geobacillus sp. 46C-IIa TaxID=1963025 RepID=UPI0009BEFBCB|nr:1,4-alpha-glucan branching enzyme [Geobacillus sp. 46C-IIa]OQP06424.1 1,4-alpha-glucan branching enzyme [Geobacillus sp. 46C-IIa]QNU28442.1 1,4-alpha-glucan branching enzyme [Geobacillus sp. 46C-IIa]
MYGHHLALERMRYGLIAANPTDLEVYLFHEGSLYQSYELFGAHVIHEGGTVGTRFCVWAPHARDVRLVGSFNDWDGANFRLRKVNDEGVWTIVVPENLEGHLYKYEIVAPDGRMLFKADPYAFYSELRPHTASIVYDLKGYQWNDQSWQRKKRRKRIYDQPMVIYELHCGSWKKKEGRFYTYREMADELIPYVLEHGFTHVELLPLIEHPLDRSWGYQGTGYYAATSRYGTPHDFMYFVDRCHQAGIGVIMDWVPGHFCKDAHGLYMFDGAPTYEYANEKDRENYVWGTANFDLGKPEVRSFLISNALFWLKYYHIDGFRVDAVANMLYWPNNDRLYENPYAVEFLRKLNEAVFAYDPNVLMIAEDSTDWPRVTAPTYEGGLGFNYKWNMGWMNDMLKYMETPPNERKHAHNQVSFSLLYAYSENFILPFSHDEVVHGKKSLLNKMPGSYEEKFAQLRLLYGYMMAHPGKKLLFMGNEFAQFDEWKFEGELDWMLFDFELHRKMNEYMKQLIACYKRYKPFYELDHDPQGFEWIDVHNAEQSIFSFIRRGKKEDDMLVIVCNFTNQAYDDYKVGVPLLTPYREVLNSDAAEFGGSGHVNGKRLSALSEPFHGKPYHVRMTIPPFGISILRPVQKRGERRKNEEEVHRHVIGRRARKSASLADDKHR